jgi:hypothetical protein
VKHISYDNNVTGALLASCNYTDLPQITQITLDVIVFLEITLKTFRNANVMLVSVLVVSTHVFRDCLTGIHHRLMSLCLWYGVDIQSNNPVYMVVNNQWENTRLYVVREENVYFW